MDLPDQTIIRAAKDAGLCFPDCWALDLDPADWGDTEWKAMRKLRAFACAIRNTSGGDFDG